VERISTAEAARRLGVSTQTVRRRIAAGTLRAERQKRPQGPYFTVLWDESEPVAAPPAGAGAELAGLRAEVERLRIEVERRNEAEHELRVLLLRSSEAVERLTDQVTRLLPAPSAEASHEPSHGASAVASMPESHPEPEPRRSGFWARLRGRGHPAP